MRKIGKSGRANEIIKAVDSHDADPHDVRAGAVGAVAVGGRGSLQVAESRGRLLCLGSRVARGEAERGGL